MTTKQSTASDATLDGLALVELVQPLAGNVDVLNEYSALVGNGESHSISRTSVYLANLVVSIAGATAFPLGALIARERADALSPPDTPIPPGMA